MKTFSLTRISNSVRTQRIFLCVALVAVACLGGCMHWGPNKAERSSSVVSFLYPNATSPLAPTNIPVLRVPLRIGIAFVPSGSANPHGGHRRAATDLSEMQKTELLRRVAAEFRGLDYIESIEIVPTTYLRPGGSFENLEQVRRMLNFDVITLVAYDQLQFTNENLLSFAYWTIVGAYIVRGNKNDTQTLMEAAVYDVASRNLLFRAPGTSQVKEGSTLIEVERRLREHSVKGFEQATDDLIKNLKVQLEDFRTRLRQAPDTIAKVQLKPGYKGGGAVDWPFGAALALLVAAAWRAGRA